MEAAPLIVDLNTSLQDLLQMQIKAARYANPLTLLPGSVPIDEHIERLLLRSRPIQAL
ncbi:MAG TPA: hypothetical protein VIG66_05195 [Noviherbaspirillum sp.]